jgi:hypothetical protein
MNVKGVVVAKSVADLHSDANNLGGETSLTEKGAPVQGGQHGRQRILLLLRELT